VAKLSVLPARLISKYGNMSATAEFSFDICSIPWTTDTDSATWQILINYFALIGRWRHISVFLNSLHFDVVISEVTERKLTKFVLDVAEGAITILQSV